jgi:hypothetical protein
VIIVADREPEEPECIDDGRAQDGPRAAEVSFVTTEHFTLQGARSSTIAEAAGRANMFLATVSGGLVALGLVATATGVGVAFYAFALIILPTLAFVGLVTFHRALQSGVEDHGYARRIARLRAYYFDHAPDLGEYLLDVPQTQRLSVQGLRGGLWQHFLTVAGMISVVTAVLVGSGAGLLGALLSGGNLIAVLATGLVVTVATLVVLTRIQSAAWRRVSAAHLFSDE